MLNVTDPAASHLDHLLQNAEAPPGAAARFVSGPRGFTLQVDHERPGDETHEHEGHVVLLIDEQTADMLTDRTLDLEQTEEGPALTLQ